MLLSTVAALVPDPNIFSAGIFCGIIVVVAAITLAMLHQSAPAGSKAGKQGENAGESNPGSGTKVAPLKAMKPPRSEARAEKKGADDLKKQAIAEQQAARVMAKKMKAEAEQAARAQKKQEKRKPAPKVAAVMVPPSPAAVINTAPAAERQSSPEATVNPAPPTGPAPGNEEKVESSTQKAKDDDMLFKKKQATDKLEGGPQTGQTAGPANSEAKEPLVAPPGLALGSTVVPVIQGSGAAFQSASTASAVTNQAAPTSSAPSAPGPAIIQAFPSGSTFTKKDDTFNLFSDAPVEETEVSKLAVTLKNVDIANLRQEADSLIRQMKALAK
jgi:hypothetical protein